MNAYSIGNLLILCANIGVLALSLKLYTEILKDQSQNRRTRQANGATK